MGESHNMEILNIGIKKIYNVRQGIKHIPWKHHYFISDIPDIQKSNYMYTLVYVKSGGIISYIGDKKKVFDEGCIYLERLSTIDFINHSLNLPTHIYVVTFVTYEEIPVIFPEDGRIKIYPHLPETIEKRFIQLHEAFLNRAPLWNLTANRYLLEFIEVFLSTFYEKHTKKKIPAFLKTCVNYINEHAYTETVNIDNLARICNVSTNHLLRVFKNEYGISPKKYINNLKIEKAAEYLSTTDLTIGEICEITGFNDFSYFCRTFKSRMGCSPSDYRTDNTKKDL